MTHKCRDCRSEWHDIWIKASKKCLGCGGELYELKTPRKTKKQERKNEQDSRTTEGFS